MEPPGLEKMEVGLFRGDTPARVIVELSEAEVVEPVAAVADGLAEADVVLRPRDSSFIVVEGTGSSLATLAAARSCTAA